MKKTVTILLAAILIFALTVPAFAATRAADTKRQLLTLTINNNSARSVLYIEAMGSTTVITGTFQLKCGNNVVQTVSVNTYGKADPIYIKTGLTSGIYTATFTGHCGSDYISLSDSATY